MQKTIYFADAKLWDKLVETADLLNMSVSALIVQAVEEKINQSSMPAMACPNCRKIQRILWGEEA